MTPKVTLEPKLLKIRKAPAVLHRKIEEYVRSQSKKRHVTLTKEHATQELLERATKNIKLPE